MGLEASHGILLRTFIIFILKTHYLIDLQKYIRKSLSILISNNTINLLCFLFTGDIVVDAVKGMSSEKLKVKYNEAALIIKTTFW